MRKTVHALTEALETKGVSHGFKKRSQLTLTSPLRPKTIPDAVGERAVLKLMFGAMIRSVKQEFDDEYEAENSPAKPASNNSSQTKISSTSRISP
ncbi:MAG: hypothetical protein IH942_01955 [Acidobacteria bacterium]|nr:hypothetical protein [Acidobacteriota bacterium]